MSKKYCLRGHDTDYYGRRADGRCKMCDQLRSAKRKRAQTLAAQQKRNREYLPDLKELRISRGYTLEEIAWESHVSKQRLRDLESLKWKATYEERVQIFQAFNVLAEREREAKEAKEYRARQLQMAGL